MVSGTRVPGEKYLGALRRVNLIDERSVDEQRARARSNGKVQPKDDARAAFRYPAFMRFQFGPLLYRHCHGDASGRGWLASVRNYQAALRSWVLVGLAQFLPGILLFLVSGHAADRFNRRNLLLLCDFGFATCFALLLAITLGGNVSIVSVYACSCCWAWCALSTARLAAPCFPHLVPAGTFRLAPWRGRPHFPSRYDSRPGSWRTDLCIRGRAFGPSRPVVLCGALTAASSRSC